MMKKKFMTSSALGLAAILVLSIVALAGTFVNPHPASATTSISTSKALPSIHLINGKGQFIDMGLMSYKDGVTGKAVVKLPDNFYLKHRPASGFALTMEDVVKFRADQGTTFKAIAKTAGAYNKGIEPGLRYGSNDDWDHFLTVKETSDFRGAYKVTYVLNQHNPCFSEESFQFAAGSIHVVQVYAGVIFADGSRAIYGASVNVIGTNASDNPTTGCDNAPSGWLSGGSGGSIFASSSSNTVIIENHVTVKGDSGGSSSSHHSNNNNNEHHDSHHDSGNNDYHHDYSHDNQNDNKHARYDKDGNPVFLPGNKDPHENQSEPDDHDSGYTGGGSYTSDTSSSDSHQQQQQEQSNNDNNHNDKPSSDHTHEQGQHQQHSSEEHSNSDNSNP